MARFILILKTLEAIFETILKLLVYGIIIYLSWKALVWMLANW